MRGKILQYNGSDGRGIIVVDGQQHSFGIGAWKGDIAPAVGKTVEVGLANGQVQALSLVGDDVLLKEKTAELTGKLASGSIVQHYGRNLLIAFGVFLIGSVFLNAISMNFLGVRQGQTLWNIAKMMEAFGGGSIKTLLLLSYLGFAVPFFWKDRRSWLVLLLPLVTMLYAFWQGRKMMGGGGGMGGSIFDVLGAGFYVSAAAAIFIALTGFKRFKSG